MPDENTKEGGTNSDKGQTSGDKGGSTRVTLAKEEHDKLVADAKASSGRVRKISELEREKTRLSDALNSATSRLDDLERRMEEARYNEIKDDPVKLRTYQDERSVTKRERELEEREKGFNKTKTELEDRIAELEKANTTSTVNLIAARYNLKADDLLDLGITDPEKLEKVASKLKPGDDGGGDQGNQDNTWKPDSNDGKGAGKPDFETMSPEAMDKYFKEHKSA
ncbi:MAG: hypothetical protein A2158_00075 [Chloroflexi bacterium RBG_13_46_14]|nr:MAG: hypothetical protein A2158_00075 [Chloroflexi bacterium RBG_13_46_14]